jgi:hypothetical protein
MGMDMKVSSFSFADQGVLGFLSHLAEGLMPAQGRSAAAEGTDKKPCAQQDPTPKVSAPDALGPAAQWWQDHPAPSTPVFWIEDSPRKG